jgi:alpha-glucoside transport system substrate-binding protein
MTSRTRRRQVVLLGSVAAAMVLAACSSSSSGAGSSAPASSTGAGASTSASAVGTSSTAAVGTSSTAASGDCAQYSAYMGHKGTTVTMYASILSPESDSLEKSWADFSKCTGIKIQYSGSNDFESQLGVRVAGGNAPDLAIIPQPGLLATMVATGKVAKPPAAVEANVTKYWNAAWKSYGSVKGTFYAAPMSANVKSFVWYSPKQFAKAGYTVPTTWDGLMQLSAKIAAAGKGKPWCGGIGSGTATGWPATDWLEELVLRQSGPTVYDQWVSHQIKFDSPQIQKSMTTLAGWMKNPAWVNGGYGSVQTIATTTFQNAGKYIPTGQCYMLQQASFYEAQWSAINKNLVVSPTGDVFAFYLPPIDPAFGKPVEGGGEFVTAFSSRPEVQAVQSYLSTPQWASSRVKVATGWVSANNGVDPALYTDPIDKLSAQFLTDPKATFRFDASDQMPSAVGSGAEWKEFTNWFASNESTNTVLKNIDAAWPSS